MKKIEFMVLTTNELVQIIKLWWITRSLWIQRFLNIVDFVMLMLDELLVSVTILTYDAMIFSSQLTATASTILPINARHWHEVEQMFDIEFGPRQVSPRVNQLGILIREPSFKPVLEDPRLETLAWFRSIWWVRVAMRNLVFPVLLKV